MEQLTQLFDLFGRIAAAAVLAVPLGWRRDRSAHSPGIRTYVLSSVAACGFLTAGRRVFATGLSEQADVIFALLGGIGFVGAAAILRARGKVEGLAHAVGLWVTAAIGAAVAYGLIGLAAAISLLASAALRIHVPHVASDGEPR